MDPTPEPLRGRALSRLLPAWPFLLCALWPGVPVAAEQDPDDKPIPDGKLPMRLSSSAFEDRQAIPRKYTCDGDDIAPPLSWEDVPEEAVSLALIVDDPDAPDPAAPKMTWVHWVVFNIPALTSGLPEGGDLPAAARPGLNTWKETGYRGPCPPKGRHRYFHKLYALDRKLDLERPDKDELESAMRPHVLAEAVLLGSYEKARPGEAAPTALGCVGKSLSVAGLFRQSLLPFDHIRRPPR